MLAELWSQLSALELDKSGRFLPVPALARIVMQDPPAKLLIRHCYTKLADFIKPGDDTSLSHNLSL